MDTRFPVLLSACALVAACQAGTIGANGGLPDAEDAEPGESSTGSAGDSASGLGGEANDPASSPSDPDVAVPVEVTACEQRALPNQPLRRLSSTQYRNTIRDLFGPELGPAVIADSIFPETTVDSGFTNDAEANVVNTAESHAIEDNAARIAALVSSDPDRFVTRLMPCGLSAGYSDAEIDDCIDRFLTEFGTRAYRRPMTDAETAIVRGLYDRIRAEQSATEAWVGVVQFFVQAPAVLYRVERGAEEVMPGMLRLTDYEMASRLSYFFLDSMPDEELFAAAAAGQLSTRAEIEAQARRLMETPAFEKALASFHRDWLQLRSLDDAAKDPDLFPTFTSEVRQSLLEETSRFVRYVLEETDGSVATLLGSEQFPLDSILNDYYGAEAVPGDGWEPVRAPHRRGLLTQASFLAAQAESDKTHPIHRGVFIQREVLCNQLPAFPGNIDIQAPLQDTSTLPTARERLSPLLEDAACSGCHSMFNPTGLAFENFDAVGLWRDTENGATIDASGSAILDGAEREFQDAVELAGLIATSEQARDCYTLQWYRAALGRREFAEDQCSIGAAQQMAAEADGNIKEILVAITQTDGFLYRRAVDEGEP